MAEITLSEEQVFCTYFYARSTLFCAILIPLTSRYISIILPVSHQTLKPTRCTMAEKLDPSELVSFKELLMANSIQVDAMAQLLIEKGIFTKDEFFTKLVQVQKEYQGKGSG